MKIDSGPLAGYHVKIAPRDKVQLYAAQVQEVLLKLDFERALVTDMSSVSDFGPFAPSEIEEIAHELGVPVANQDRIWEIAERLFEKEATSH